MLKRFEVQAFEAFRQELGLTPFCARNVKLAPRSWAGTLGVCEYAAEQIAYESAKAKASGLIHNFSPLTVRY
jgi:hypothetical protein